MAVKKKKATVAKKAARAKAVGDDGAVRRIEEYAMGAAGSMGVPQFPAWITAYFHPYKAYGAEKGNANMGTSTVTLAMVGLVQAVVAIVVMALALSFALPALAGMPITVAGAIFMLIAYPIGSVIFGFIASLVYYIVAMVLGGKGSFWEQTYGMALVSGGIALLMAPFSVLQVIPAVGWIFSLAGLAIAIYGIVSQYRMIRAVHSLSQLRAIVVLLVPAILIMAFVLFVVGFATIAAIGAYGAGMAAQVN